MKYGELLESAYDWRSAMGEALSDKDYEIPEDAEVIASDEGFNEGPDWVCVVRLSDGTWIFAAAGCDYTGWDCQASGDAWSAPDLASLLLVMDESARERLGEQLARAEVERAGGTER